MEQKKQSVKVNIFGEDYPIKGDAEDSYIQEVARYVDQKMKEVAERMSNKLPVRVAVLAAMSITDELFKERDERKKRLLDVEERSQSLLELLAERVGEEDTQ
ncbi:MAG: cell division protein ZapA [Candidatus Zixiibacteriota bacterium]